MCWRRLLGGDVLVLYGLVLLVLDERVAADRDYRGPGGAEHVHDFASITS